MNNNFDDLIEKINEIENNNTDSSDIIAKTIDVIAKDFNIHNSIIVKFNSFHGLNQKFYDKHSKKIDKNIKDLSCTICQSDIKSREHKIHLDQCGHYFHKKCLNRYLKITKINFKCPVCQKSYKSSFCNIIQNDYNLSKLAIKK